MISRYVYLVDYDPYDVSLLEFLQVSASVRRVGVELGRVPGLVGG